MYYFLAALAAVLIAVMVAINGFLSAIYAIHLSTLIIHVCGLALISAAALAKRERVLSVRGISPALFCGGAIGYLTTLFNVMAIGRISVTAILALSLLGQAVTSLVIDQFGLFGMPVKKFNSARLLGLCCTGAGIVFLLTGGGDGGNVFVPAFVSFLTGITVVTSRQVNAQLAEKTSVTVSTWYNYAVGLVTSAAALVIFLLFGADIPFGSLFSGAWWIYLGGPVGVVIVFLSNIVTMKMPALVMTLIMFAGQVFGGVAIDAVIHGDFSWRSLAGGAFAFLGLVLNVWLDARRSGKKSA